MILGKSSVPNVTSAKKSCLTPRPLRRAARLVSCIGATAIAPERRSLRSLRQSKDPADHAVGVVGLPGKVIADRLQAALLAVPGDRGV